MSGKRKQHSADFKARVALAADEAQGNYASVECSYTETGTIHVFRGNVGNTLPVPGAPSTVTAAAGSGEVTVRRSGVSYATGYNLYWSNGPGVSPSSV